MVFRRGKDKLSVDVSEKSLPRVRALVKAVRSGALEEGTLAPLIEGDLPSSLRISGLGGAETPQEPRPPSDQTMGV